MAKKESGEVSEFAKRLAAFMERLHAAVAEARGGELSDREFHKIYEAFLKSRGLGSIAAAHATLAAYWGRGSRKVKDTISDESALSLAAFAQAYLGPKDPGWGNDPDDLDTPLNYLRGLLLYGPDAKPSATRFAGMPTVKKILGGASPEVARIKKDVSRLRDITSVLEVVRFSAEHGQALEQEIIDVAEEDEPEPPCNLQNPTWLALQILLQLGEEPTPEVVEDIASRAKMEVERVKEILCGAEPSSEEIAALATVPIVGGDRFQDLVGFFAVKLQTAVSD